jgi:hypothetical protein
MPSDTEARKAALISKFWAASFEVEGANDVALWINYISMSVHDLGMLGETISDASKVARLQTPLPLGIFREYKIANSSKGLEYKDAEANLREYAQIPEVAEQLRQLSTTRRHRPEGSIFGAATLPKEECRNFIKGKCDRGTFCRYSHGGKSPSLKEGCKHCGRTHESDKCWTKFPHLRPAKPRGDKFAHPKKDTEVVMQIITDAMDNGQQKIDLQTLLMALKKDQAAKLFTFAAQERKQDDRDNFTYRSNLDVGEVMALAQAFRNRERGLSEG